MQQFIEEQYTKDKTHIWNEHLAGGFSLTSPFKPIDNNYTEVCDAIFLGKKYRLYRNKLCGMNLIPEDLIDFSDDFAPIIKFSQNFSGTLAFSFISMQRKNGVIETKLYTFLTSQDNMPQVICQFATSNDENNHVQQEFLKSGKTLTQFIAQNKHLSAAHDKDTITVKVQRNKTTTRWNVGEYNLPSMTKEKLADYFSYPYNSSDNESSLIKLAEEIYKKELDMKESKKKQKA